MWKRTASGLWVSKGLSAKTAARPHWSQIVSAWAGIVIGISGIVISIFSLWVARRALDTSQQTLKIGQRAYLNISEIKYADDLVQIYFKNSGNTPATIRSGGFKVVIAGNSAFDDLFNRSVQAKRPGAPNLFDVRRLSTSLPLISETTVIGGKEGGWLKVACESTLLTKDLPDTLLVAALVRYRDVFDESHVTTAGWLMKNLGITGEVSPLVVDILLASHFPADVSIPTHETIDEFNREEPLPSK